MSGEPGDWPRGLRRYAPFWLQRLGVGGWLVLGAIGAGTVLVWLFSSTAGVAIPLIIAVVVGVIFAPLVDVLERWRVPRSLGSLITMFLLVALFGFALYVTVQGIVSQVPQIQQQLEAGVAALKSWIAGLGLSSATVKQANDTATQSVSQAGRSAASAVMQGISSVTSLLIGMVVGLNMLFFVLRDSHVMGRWIGTHIGLPEDVGHAIMSDAGASLRGYFKGTTIVATSNAVVVAIGLVLLDMPLVGAITVVTFLTAYIPYIGAVIAGAFAVIVALGAGGLAKALAVLVLMLLANNVLQQVVQSFALGGALDLHPAVILVVTVLGGVVAGVLGVTLAAPLTAMVVRGVTHLNEAGFFTDQADGQLRSAPPPP